MASYIDNILTPGETVHATARMTGWIWFWPIVVTVLTVGILSPVLLMPWIRQSTTNMVVTDRRVIAKFGLISRRAIEMRISKIESIQVDQTLLGRMLGYGTVLVHGTGGTFEPLSLVSDPLAFKRAIEEQVNAFEDGARAGAVQTEG